jgi:glycosyltransferase involved in cell wall biosynthesis
MYHGNLAASLVQCLSFQSIPVLWSVRQTVYSLNDEKARTAALIRLSAILSRRAIRIVYASRVSADQHEALGFSPDRTTIIPNGFDCEQFKPSPRAGPALRRQLDVGENAILIGLISRFHPMKDHATFLRAARMISQQNPTVCFVLAGQGVDWANPVITDLIERLELGGRVHLLGERQDIPELTAGLDIATNSSAFAESFPNVIGEAMACGVPCVVTDVGHSAAIVGDSGFVVPPRNPAALAAAWTRLVDVGRAGRAKLGADAQQRIAQSFSLARVVRQYAALYEQALQHDG